MVRLTLLLFALWNFTQMLDCGPSPTLSVSNEPNQSGGTLHISGAIATHGGLVHVGILNGPDRTAPINLPNLTADSSGIFKVDFPYTFNPTSNRPGCQFASSNQGYSLNVSATDVAANAPSFATVAIADCGW